MKLLIVTSLLALALAEDPLRAVLKSPKAALNLYSSFKSQNHLSYGAGEDRMRFRVFIATASHVADYNEDDQDSAHYGINFFTSMTSQERKQYLGLNVTGQVMGPEPALQASSRGLPSELLWTSTGAVTKVKNQGSCGSCWTFSGVGGIETHYQALTGVLRDFSEQEFLDCVYEAEGGDGCDGGFQEDCFKYSSRVGHLASERTYAYKGKDKNCRTGSTPNALIAAKVTGVVEVARSESAHIAALQKGALSVAFEVTDKFFSYDGAISRDTTCTGEANHAVTMVGYAPNYLLVKNSWGASWGDQGFVKFARHHHNCELLLWTSYPRMQGTGRKDRNGNDAAAKYTPSKESDDGEDEDCEDTQQICERYAAQGMCSGKGASWDHYMGKHCRKACGLCGGCPRGTVKCPDGVCRHQHMC